MNKIDNSIEMPEYNRIPVVLIADHEHGGEQKKAGDSILVTEQQHIWLREQGKVE